MRRPFALVLAILLLPACRGRHSSAPSAGGKREARILWSVDVNALAFPSAAPAIGPDGTVYARGLSPATLTWDGRPAREGMLQAFVHAIDSAGNRARSLPGTNIRTVPNFQLWIRMAPWGAAYAVDSEGGLYGMFTDGTQHYRQVKGSLIGPPAIADNGRLFVGAGRGVVGFDLQSEDDPSATLYEDTSYALAPVFAPGGDLYVPSLRYLHALSPNGEVRWSANASLASPVLGPQGTVYCSDKNRLLAIDPNGTQLWDFHADDTLTVPAVGPDGTVAVIGAQGLVHVLAPDGSRKWSFALESAAWSQPVVGGDGTIYASDRLGRVTAITPAGKRRWSVKMPMACGTPAVDGAGRLFVECRDGKVYAVAPPS